MQPHMKNELQKAAGEHAARSVDAMKQYESACSADTAERDGAQPSSPSMWGTDEYARLWHLARQQPDDGAACSSDVAARDRHAVDVASNGVKHHAPHVLQHARDSAADMLANDSQQPAVADTASLSSQLEMARALHSRLSKHDMHADDEEQAGSSAAATTAVLPESDPCVDAMPSVHIAASRAALAMRSIDSDDEIEERDVRERHFAEHCANRAGSSSTAAPPRAEHALSHGNMSDEVPSPHAVMDAARHLMPVADPFDADSAYGGDIPVVPRADSASERRSPLGRSADGAAASTSAPRPVITAPAVSPLRRLLSDSPRAQQHQHHGSSRLATRPPVSHFDEVIDGEIPRRDSAEDMRRLLEQARAVASHPVNDDGVEPTGMFDAPGIMPQALAMSGPGRFLVQEARQAVLHTDGETAIVGSEQAGEPRAADNAHDDAAGLAVAVGGDDSETRETVLNRMDSPRAGNATTTVFREREPGPSRLSLASFRQSVDSDDLDSLGAS